MRGCLVVISTAYYHHTLSANVLFPTLCFLVWDIRASPNGLPPVALDSLLLTSALCEASDSHADSWAPLKGLDNEANPYGSLVAVVIAETVSFVKIKQLITNVESHGFIICTRNREGVSELAQLEKNKHVGMI
jgi:hypothetical protein